MNHELEIVRTAAFMNVQCDFYKDQQDTYCLTTEQLGMALGYRNPIQSIRNLVQRHHYLNSPEFKGVTKVITPGGEQDITIFTEDGIYEVTMLAKTARAREFRAFVREILNRMVAELVRSQKELVDRFNIVMDKLVRLPELGYHIEKTHKQKRSHSKVTRCNLEEEIKPMIRAGHTYQEIADALQRKGVSISRSSVNRFGRKYLNGLNQ